ncbi:MAG: hypothetical protein AB7F59_01520 [Bdellovibrionales bacterium]
MFSKIILSAALLVALSPSSSLASVREGFASGPDVEEEGDPPPAIRERYSVGPDVEEDPGDPPPREIKQAARPVLNLNEK